MLESGVPTSVVSADRYVVEAEYRNSDLEADEYPVEFLCGRYSLSLAPARALSAPGFNDYLIKHTITRNSIGDKVYACWYSQFLEELVSQRPTVEAPVQMRASHSVQSVYHTTGTW